MARTEEQLRADIINDLIQARKEHGLSQKGLEQLSGVKQQLIARIETGATNPQIETLLRILRPLNLTLAIVNIDESRKED